MVTFGVIWHTVKKEVKLDEIENEYSYMYISFIFSENKEQFEPSLSMT